MLNSDLIPSSLEVISAAFAASSSLGALLPGMGLPLRSAGVDDPMLGECGRDGWGLTAGRAFPFAFGGALFVLAKGEAMGKLGSTDTGIIKTFLNEVRKSVLSACRLLKFAM